MTDFGRQILERSYQIPLTLFDSAFRFFQRKYVIPRNTVLTVIFLALCGVYIHAAVKDSGNMLAYFLTALCAAIVLSIWYKMFKLRRAVHEALKEIGEDTYTLTACENGLVIRTETLKQEPEVHLQGTEEEAQKPAEVPEGKESESGGNGFQQLFPEAPAEAAEQIPPTEIPFSKGVKIHETDEYFMVYIVRQNFFVIPKKDFSEKEQTLLRELFAKNA